MFGTKRYFYSIIMFCFLISSLSFHLWAGTEEESKKITSDQKKAESRQKRKFKLRVEGSTLKIVPLPEENASEQKKSESKQENVPTENQPRITFDSTKYDAGEVWEGDEVSHTFIAKNKGTAQLNISKVKPG